MITEDMRSKWKNQIEIIQGSYDADQLDMNDWEIGFFDSIYDKVINQGQDLSWKQSKVLSELYGKIG